jgi:hypothetical protein
VDAPGSYQVPVKGAAYSHPTWNLDPSGPRHFGADGPCLHTATVETMIVWLNGTHGAGKTTTSALVQPLLPGSRVLDTEKIGEMLMDITPGLPGTDNFQDQLPT